MISIDGIRIHKHDGNVKMYLYYNEQNSNRSHDEISTSMTPPAPADTTMTAPSPIESENQDNTNWEKDYSVLYKDMRVRDKPGLDGKALATLNEGDVVTFYGEKSDNKSLITIKGQPILSTWMKIKTKNGVTGWVVSCALQEYYDPNWD
jgi:hypothetical protein